MSAENKLTIKNRLATCESTIERTKTAFVECGQALAEIRDAKLYMLTHENFESYCQERWGWGRQYAYQLIECAEVKSSSIGSRLKNQAQAKEIAKVEPDKRAEVLDAAEKTGKITAQSIQDARKTVEVVDVDQTGWPIPKEILDDWSRAEDLSDLVRKVSEVKVAVEAGLAGDIAFAELTNSTLADIKNVYTSLKNLIPYAVCPSCQGRNREKCAACRRRGFVSKFAYDHHFPREVKEIREKAKERRKK